MALKITMGIQEKTLGIRKERKLVDCASAKEIMLDTLHKGHVLKTTRISPKRGLNNTRLDSTLLRFLPRSKRLYGGLPQMRKKKALSHCLKILRIVCLYNGKQSLRNCGSSCTLHKRNYNLSRKSVICCSRCWTTQTSIKDTWSLVET